MTLKDYEFTDNNHFIAMEYYNLIMNRTYLVLITSNKIIGILGNGTISTEGGKDILTKTITRMMSVRGDLSNPFSYLKNKYLEEVQNIDLENNDILIDNKSNFIINRQDIKNVYYDPKKKFGMGKYPHDGKVFIETNDNKKREFIILGNQSGQEIAESLLIRK